MILPALIQLYDRIEADPDVKIAPPGYSQQKISFCVELNPDGTLHHVEDVRVTVQPTGSKGKAKVLARQVFVPGQSKPSGQGLNPCFLWDNAQYMLGYKADDPKPERTKAAFEAFREKHVELASEIDDEAFHAVCAFLKTWKPENLDLDKVDPECLTSFGVFRVRLPGTLQFVHQRPAVKAWWQASQGDAAGADDDEGHGGAMMPSLVDGRVGRVARLHEPAIKGVVGAQTSGARLVSFNADAFTSYGKSQGQNAPISEGDAFKYCTALNHLLADRDRRTGIGDATVTWWAESPSAGGELLFAAMIGARVPGVEEQGAAEPENAAGESDDEDGVSLGVQSEDVATLAHVRAAIERLSRGEVPNEFANDRTRFHVLGLSPNAARLSVRFWWTGELGEMLEHVRQHHEDMRLEPPDRRFEGQAFSIYRVVRETARVLGDRADMDTVSPTLAGELARAILTGGPYPQSLLATVLRRTRTDGHVSHARCAIVKACITRRRRVQAGLGGIFEEVPVVYSEDGPLAYQIGALFAILEKTQEESSADGSGRSALNTTLKDRYFSGASCSPASVIPRLLNLHQYHIRKLRTMGDGRKAGLAAVREKRIREIMCKIKDTGYPRHLNIEQQGLFQIGYYHQRQDLFTKKADTAEAANVAEEN